MIVLEKGRYTARQTDDPSDIAAAQALRARCFGLDIPADRDAFDAKSVHILLEDTADGSLVCCFRLLPLQGCDLPSSYAAQFYELSALSSYDGLMVEVGRFCVTPDRTDPDILRLRSEEHTSELQSLPYILCRLLLEKNKHTNYNG